MVHFKFCELSFEHGNVESVLPQHCNGNCDNKLWRIVQNADFTQTNLFVSITICDMLTVH